MRLDRQLPFEIRLSKKGIVYGVLLSIALSFLINVPFAHGFTNQFTQISELSCNTCSNPMLILDTAASTGDLIVIELTCQSSYAITGITDTISNVFSNSMTSQSYSVSNVKIYSSSTGTSTNQYTFVWFGKAVSTGASTASVTTSSASSNCILTSLEGNTSFSAFNFAFSSQPAVYLTSSNLQLQTFSTTQTIPANSIVLLVGQQIAYYNTVSCANPSASDSTIPPIGYLTSNCTTNVALTGFGTCGGASGCVLRQAQATFQTNTNTPVSLGFNFDTFSYGLAQLPSEVILGYVFSITGTIQATGTNIVSIGCSGSLQSSSHNFALPSNQTVWIQGNAFGLPPSSFLTLTNLSVWINSVVLHNHQPTAFLSFVVYTQNIFSPNNNNLNLPSAGNVYTGAFSYPNTNTISGQSGLLTFVGLPVNNNTGKSHFSVAGLTIGFQPGEQFALGLYSTHNGINIGTCSTGSPQLYEQGRTNSFIPFGPLTNLPQLTGATAINGNITLGTVGLEPGTTTIQTVTNTVAVITSFTTVTTTTTTGIATTTQTVTTTVVTNALSGPTGSTIITANLITYLPIWMLPLIFGFLGGLFGFGLGGLLFGLMTGLVIGQLNGIIPIWTVFIDAIMIYLLLRR